MHTQPPGGGKLGALTEYMNMNEQLQLELEPGIIICTAAISLT